MSNVTAKPVSIAELIDNYARVVEQRDKLLAALSDLVDACEFWDDQDDPVLVAARDAIKSVS